MDEDTVLLNLKNLEETIRHNSNGTEFIFLENMDHVLKDNLKSVFENYKSESFASPIVPVKKVLLRNKETLKNTPVINIDEPVLKSTTVKPLVKPIENLDSLKFNIRNCQLCELNQARKTIVFGQGNQNADLVFVGDAPEEQEDNKGLAFVGKAGLLLTQIIHSIGISRESVYVCNVVKCRPPEDRNPNLLEIKSCSPTLFKQLRIIKPKLIVTLGNIATKTLIPDALGIMKVRGILNNFEGIPVLPTFHPSYLFRNKHALNLVWDDMCQIRKILFQAPINAPSKTHQQED